MTLATRTIQGNHSGPLARPKVVIMHSTRSGIASKTDAEELTSTLNWFQNPNGASAHFVLSETERVRCVDDNKVAWHAGHRIASLDLKEKSWGVETTQPTIDRPFTEGHYANLAMIGRHYVSLGVAPVWLDYWDGSDISGFVDHEDTSQGRDGGKTDIGYQFDRARFIASLEDFMNPAQIAMLDKAAADVATLQAQVDTLLNLTNSVNFGDDHATMGERIAELRAHAANAAKHGSSGGSVTIPSVTVPVE